ncbi:hypothetical protein JMN23_13475 [Bacillus sp. RHFB]|nr:hypothetical protein [Bacillus sp. RHFB]
MVMHDLKAATRGNRIIYLKDGRIDGELNLDSFGEDNLKEREEAVSKFIKDKNWWLVVNSNREYGDNRYKSKNGVSYLILLL